MKVFYWKFNFGFILWFFLVTKIKSQVPGWHLPNLISEKVLSYSVAKDLENGALYVILEEKGKETKDLVLLFPTGERKILFKISEQKISLKPTLAVCNQEIWLSWQQTQGKLSTLFWLYSADGGENFNPVEKFTKDKSLLLPKISCDREGNFYLAYQEEGDLQMNLKLAIGKKGKFFREISINDFVRIEHRGIFLPFLLSKSLGADLFFQVRKESNLTDEIFWLDIRGPDNFYKAVAITENDYHDYAPFAFRFGKGFSLVWQSNPDKVWSIFLRNFEGNIEKINQTFFDAQNPSLLVLPDNTYVVAWLDFRKLPAQVYAKFLGRKPDLPVSQEHALTNLEALSSPQLVYAQDGGFIYYLARNNLYRQKIDNETGKIMITSISHPEGKARALRRGEFFIQVQNEISGIHSAGYLVSDKLIQEIPIFNMKSIAQKVVIENLPKGKSYFHFQYQDKAGNLSPVKSYPIIVDLDLPNQVEIISASHEPNSISMKTEAEFLFQAKDDTGISGYYYFLSKNPQSRFTHFTKEPYLKFSNLKPGIYYLGLQAEDLAGNLSHPRVISFQIVAQMVPEVQIFFQNLSNELQLEASSSKEISKIKYGWLLSWQDLKPKTGEALAEKQENSLYVFKIPREKNILRFSLEFADKTQSPNYYYFPSEVPIVFNKKFNITQESQEKGSGEVVLPEIFMQKAKTHVEFTFTVAPSYEPFLKGFAFSLNEELKSNEINSLTGKEVFYNLPSGENWLEVKPIFSSKKYLGEKIVFKFHVEGKKEKKISINPITVAIFVLLGLLFVIKRKPIIFYLSYFKK